MLLDEALDRALELDPDHPDVLLARGKYADDLYATERFYVRALEVDPGHSLIRRELGWVLLWQGRLEEAVGAMRQALELDPLSPHAHHSMAAAYLFRGNYDRVEEESEECLHLDPAYWFCHWDAYEAAIQKGEYDQAIKGANDLAGFADIPFSSELLALRAQLLQVATETEKEGILKRAIELGESGNFWAQVARAYAAAGRPEAALEHLERAVVDGNVILYALVPYLHPDFKPLHGHPRFEAALDRFYHR